MVLMWGPGNYCLSFWWVGQLQYYRNFRSFTRTADYPHRPIIAYGEKKSQQITRTGG